jgi:opacity protein-like surface antigen
MWYKKSIFVAIVLALVMMASCSKKVTQPVIEVNQPSQGNGQQVGTTNVAPADIYRYYQADWSSLKTGGNAKIDAGGKSLSSSMQMRMQRGKCIYVSLRPMMGIEVAKMVIFDDTILLVDKIHKRYMLEKASLLTGGVPVTVGNLQDIFLGRAFELGKGSLTQSIKDDFTLEDMDGGKVRLKPREQFKGFDYNFVYDKQNNILSLDVSPTKAGASTYSVAYADVKGTVAGKVATSLKVSTKMNGRAFTLALEYKDLKWNEDFTVDTAAPKKYTRVEGNDIMQLLSGGK